MAFLIKWNRKAIKQFEGAIRYIENNSLVDAAKFQLEILNKIDELLASPEKCSPDKYKKNNDGTFRAFEIYHYRISYRFIKDEIRIIRVRHTKMSPSHY